jgi:hypothetical protein
MNDTTNQEPKNRYVDVDEFAKVLCTEPATVYKLIRLRQIPVRKLFSGRRTYILIDAQQALAVLERKYGRDAHGIP